MKKFILENWYKVMIGSSLVMASFGFMVYSITSALANDSKKSTYQTFPLNADGTVSVKLSDEQLNRIIPKNDDGSINIRLNEEQLRTLTPQTIQSVNIEQVRGVGTGFISSPKGGHVLLVGTCEASCP